MSIDMKLLKQLRLETSVSIADCRKALEESKNDYKKALDWVCKNGLEKAAKKADRETPQGLVESYIHQNGLVGALLRFPARLILLPEQTYLRISYTKYACR